MASQTRAEYWQEIAAAFDEVNENIKAEWAATGTGAKDYMTREELFRLTKVIERARGRLRAAWEENDG